MAVTYYQVPKWLRGNSPKMPWVDKFKEAASQSATTVKGNFVYLVAGAGTIAAVTSTIIWGILKQACSTVTGTLLEVEVVESGDILEISYADAFSTTPPIVGHYYDIVNSSGQAYLTTSSSNPVLVVRRITDTTKHRCEVSVIPAAVQASIGAAA